MKLKFIKPADLDRNLKATIHKTGKLGFTVEAAKRLQLDNDKTLYIAINDDDKEDKNLYVLVVKGKSDEGFRVSKAGGYFYVNTKDLFENLKVDYITDNIVYDIRDFNISGQEGYVFRRRVSNKKEDETENAG